MKIEIKINGNEYKFHDLEINYEFDKVLRCILDEIVMTESKLNPSQNIVGENSIKYTPFIETLK